MVEWFKAAVLKTAGAQAPEGSNPSLSAIFFALFPGDGQKITVKIIKLKVLFAVHYRRLLMNIIELHRDFSERYPYARSSEETTEKHCGQIDNITFEATRKRNYL